MTLAQVVYQVSIDADFASSMRSDPENALAARGWGLSKEELAFLVTVLKREAQEFARSVRLEDLLTKASPWTR